MTDQPSREALDIEEQIERVRRTRIEQDKFVIETRKIAQDTRLATPQMFFQGALAMAALIGAGAALAKLLT